MKSFRNYLIILIVLFVGVSVDLPFRYGMTYPQDIRPEFDPRIRSNYRKDIDRLQPDMVLIGNSMLKTDVDVQALSTGLDRKIYSLPMGGTATAVWYLMLKNEIVPAGHHPAYLVIFFPDTMLTEPAYRVTGNYFTLVDEVAGADEELLIQRAYINPMNPLDRFAEAYLPVYSARWKLRETIDYYLRYSAARYILGCDQACLDDATGTVFRDNNLDPKYLDNLIAIADDALYTDAALDFNRQVGRSFLPEIIRLCRENNIHLVLVRVPVRQFQGPGSEPAGLAPYLRDLQAYLAREGVTYLDPDPQQTIPIEDFSDLVHMNDLGKVELTRRLVEALKPILK